MKLTLTIEMNGAAFSEAGNGREAARILRKAADRMDDLYDVGEAGEVDRLLDANGNAVGSVVLSESAR
jgi:hypothetical protein